MGWFKKTFTIRQLVTLAVFSVVFSFGTVSRLNIETLAQGKGWDRYLADWAGPMSDIFIAFARALSSDLAIGIAVGAVVIAFWGWITSVLRGIRLKFQGRSAGISSPQASESSVPDLNFDMLVVLHYIVDDVTLRMLDGLIDIVPKAHAQFSTDLPSDPQYEIHACQTFLASIRGGIVRGSHRFSEFQSVLGFAEAEAEREIEQTPVDQRPSGIDPLLLRRYLIAHKQCVHAVAFLKGQRKDVLERMISQRSKLIERLSVRNPD